MPILLTLSKTRSSQKSDITFCNNVTVKPTHCSSQTKSKIEGSFKKSLLSFLLLIGLLGSVSHGIYDGLGRRIETTSGASTISYYYDPMVEHRQLGSCQKEGQFRYLDNLVPDGLFFFCCRHHHPRSKPISSASRKHHLRLTPRARRQNQLSFLAAKERVIL